MWSPANGTRNRVSPIQKPEHKRNGYTQSWDEPGGSASSVQVDVDQNGSVQSPALDLTKLIRKRRYGALDSRVEGFLEKRENQTKWTPPLTERLKNKDFTKSERARTGCSAWMYRRKQTMRELGYKLELWRSWFKRIEGHQGTGVLSYFTFLKWMLFLNIYIFLLVFCFIVLPAIIMNPRDTYTTAVTSSGLSSVSTTDTVFCSGDYNVTYSSSAGDVILDFLQGTGWMEQTALFYGWYEAKELNLNSTYYILPLAFFLTTLGVLLLSLILMARFTIGSMKVKGNYEIEQTKTEYCNKTFGNWDYGLDDETTGEFKKKSIYKDIVANLDHQRFILTKAQRTSCKTCIVYAKRILVNILILAILGGSGYLIYFVTECSTDYTDGNSSGTIKFLLMQYLPSLTITGLNVVVPLMFELLIILEDYTEDVVVKLTLVRTVFLRLASLTVLIVSLYVSITCSTKDTRCAYPTTPCTKIKCWETHVGQSFYRLIVVDYFVHILVIFCYELPRKLITTKCPCWICKKIGPAEFIVYISVLDLVYTQALCWIGFLYCPLITGCAVISFVTQFYLKLFSALYTTVPPVKPYKASKSNSFFMIVLLVTFFLSCFPVGYSMVRMTPSRGCGPFRIYSDMSTIVDVTINNFTTWLQSTIEIFTSASFIILLLTLLCLAIYYLYARGSAYKERANVTTEQLVMEGKDKQYILAEIYRLRGEGRNRKENSKRSLPPLTNRKENGLHSSKDYDTDVAEKAKTFIENDVPPPTAYGNLDITWRRKARMDLYARH